MFTRRLILVLALITTVTFAAPAAASEVTPNGPFVTSTQSVQINSWYSYPELVKALRGLEERAQGDMTLEVLGKSREGRDIFLAKVGHGPDRVFVITQQHGNEPHGTQAAVNLIQNLISSGNAATKNIMKKLTLYIVPRMNPDGCERWQRENYDPAAPNPRTFAKTIGFVDENGNTPSNLANEKYGMYSRAGIGWDLNRFHFIDWTTSPMYKYFSSYYPTNPGVESELLAKYISRMDPKPLWFVDVHNQGSTRTPDGELVTFALDTAHMTNDWASDLTYSIVHEAARLLVICKDAVSRHGYVGISRYQEPSAYAGRSRNQYMQKLGIPGILIEMREEGQKSTGYLNKVAEQQLYALLEKTAANEWHSVDWTRVNEIPQDAPEYYRDLPANPGDDASAQE